MRESRVKRNIIILAGVTTLLLVGVILGWYFVLQRPQKALLATATTDYETQLAEAKKLPQALAAQKKAEDRLQYVKGQYEFLRRRYRNLYFSDIGADYASATPLQKANREAIWRYWMNYYYNGYGPALRDELESVANANGVHIISTISVVPPPNKPEDVMPPSSGFLKPVGASTATGGAAPAPTTPPAGGAAAGAGGDGSISVTVAGPLSNVLRYFDSLNANSTLVKVGTIKLDTDAGPPAGVKATFTLTPYLLTNGPGALISGAGADSPAGIARPGNLPIVGNPSLTASNPGGLGSNG